MNTELSDEQLGRLWCERNNRAPDYDPLPGYLPWRWVCDDGPVYGLPHPIWDAIYDTAGISRFSSEYLAYAAVGAALRFLHRLAGEIAAVLGGVL